MTKLEEEFGKLIMELERLESAWNDPRISHRLELDLLRIKLDALRLWFDMNKQQ